MLSLSSLPGIASAGTIDLGRQKIVFSGTVSSVDDPTGALQNAVAVGDAYTVTVQIPIDMRSVGSNAESVVAGYLDGYYRVDVGGLVWKTTGQNTLPGGEVFASHPYVNISDDSAAGDFFNFTTDPLGWSFGSPIASIPYWEGNVGAGSPFRAEPFVIDPFEAPDPMDFVFAGSYVYGYAYGSSDPLYRIEANLSASRLVQVPEPCTAWLAGASLLALLALAVRREQGRHLHDLV